MKKLFLLLTTLLFILNLFTLLSCSFDNSEEIDIITENLNVEKRITLPERFTIYFWRMRYLHMKISSQTALELFLDTYGILQPGYFPSSDRDDFLSSYSDDFFSSNNLFVIGLAYIPSHLKYGINFVSIEETNIYLDLTKYVDIEYKGADPFYYDGEILLISVPSIKNGSLSVNVSLIVEDDATSSGAAVSGKKYYSKTFYSYGDTHIKIVSSFFGLAFFSSESKYEIRKNHYSIFIRGSNNEIIYSVDNLTYSALSYFDTIVPLTGLTSGYTIQIVQNGQKVLQNTFRIGIFIEISGHSHSNYSYSQVIRDPSHHVKICICGFSIIQGHSIHSHDAGNHFANCVLCGANVYLYNTTVYIV
jgi:hypothetical protein